MSGTGTIVTQTFYFVDICDLNFLFHGHFYRVENLDHYQMSARGAWIKGSKFWPPPTAIFGVLDIFSLMGRGLEGSTPARARVFCLIAFPVPEYFKEAF